MKTVEVAAALIREGDRFLICRRPPEKARGLLWEYPGGKLEAGETAEAAIIRECREELGVELEVTRAVAEVTHSYPDIRIKLTLLETRIARGTPTLLEHVDLRWITPEEIEDFEFCPADTQLNELIRKAFQ